VRLGPAPPSLSYLDVGRILAAAEASGATAVHPGYGFLSESAAFAERVLGSGLTWVGPPPAAMRSMGDKAQAKTLMGAAGVPVVPGYHGEDQSDER
jgi:acetyl/propionyl-CoA carboxylase alpha subunit